MSTKDMSTTGKKESTDVGTTDGKSSKWETQKEKLKASFPELTESDLNYDESQKKEMLSKLEAKVGKTDKELRTIIETL